jgi:hypothetical protein
VILQKNEDLLFPEDRIRSLLTQKWPLIASLPVGINGLGFGPRFVRWGRLEVAIILKSMVILQQESSLQSMRRKRQK